jgi:hypothetical protein
MYLLPLRSLRKILAPFAVNEFKKEASTPDLFHYQNDHKNGIRAYSMM